jgi:SHAQKYF class myb-like DNA-binding protein
MNDEIKLVHNEFLSLTETLTPSENNFRKDSIRTLTEDNESLLDSGDINNNKYSTGRWSQEEHNKFIEAMFLYGNEWKRVQQHIKTRSSTQARSHAQKFFIRLKKKLSEEHLDQELLNINPSNRSSRRNEIIMSWIQENVSSDLLKDKFYTEKRDKLCKIIMNLIANPIKRKVGHRLTPVRNCCSSGKRSHRECPQVCYMDDEDNGNLSQDDSGIFKIEKINKDDFGLAEVNNSKNNKSVVNIISINLGERSRKGNCQLHYNYEDESKNDPFKLSFCESENSKKDYSEFEINNFDLDYFFGENSKI